MSLAERINKLTPTGPGLPCGIGKLMSQLGDVDKEALVALFASNPYPNGVSNRLIFRILEEEGYNIAFASIRLHRAKMCRCFVGKNSPYRTSPVTMPKISETTSTSKIKTKTASKSSKSKAKKG
jgi:hypothetical protein